MKTFKVRRRAGGTGYRYRIGRKDYSMAALKNSEKFNLVFSPTLKPEEVQELKAMWAHKTEPKKVTPINLNHIQDL